MDDTQPGLSTKMGSALPETHATQLQIATSIPSSFEDPSSSNAELASIISQLRHSSQNIVVDCEPLQNSAQVFQFSSLLDGVLLVVEAENQRREVIGRTLESLKRAQIPVMGTVLSKRKQYIPPMIYRML
jgi:Mrp family chromosome partitioning ATPase